MADEWETIEGFQQFFAGNPDIGAITAEAGVTSEPEAKVLARARYPGQVLGSPRPQHRRWRVTT